MTNADWRFDGGTDLQLPIADLKSAITREALAEGLNERWGVYKRLVEASPNPHKQSILVSLCPNALIVVENFFEELKEKVGNE